MAFWNPLSWVLPKRSRTALVLVQPYTLLSTREVPKGPSLVRRKRSFEDIVSKARKSGAYIAHVTYSDLIWWNLLEISDYVFVFVADKGFRKLKKEEQARKLSEKEKGYLGERCNKNTAIFAGTGNPESYSVVAETLAPIFSKKGIRQVVVCGGFDKQCIKLFLGKMHEKEPQLKIIVPLKFIARGFGLRSFSEVLGSEGMPVELSDCDAESLLKLF